MSFSADLLNICCDILYEGIESLGMDLAFVSRVQEGTSEVVAVVPPSGLFQPGDIYALDSTFCGQVLQKGEILGLTEFDGSPGLQKHPCYFSLGAEAYLGAPIVVDGEFWGILSYSSRDIRPQPFEPKDLRFVNRAAEEIAAACAEQGILPRAEHAQRNEESAAHAEQPAPSCVIPMTAWTARPQTPARRA